MSSLNTQDASGSVLSIPNPHKSTFGPPTGGSYRTPAAQKRAQVQASHHSAALERHFYDQKAPKPHWSLIWFDFRHQIKRRDQCGLGAFWFLIESLSWRIETLISSSQASTRLRNCLWWWWFALLPRKPRVWFPTGAFLCMFSPKLDWVHSGLFSFIPQFNHMLQVMLTGSSKTADLDLRLQSESKADTLSKIRRNMT